MTYNSVEQAMRFVVMDRDMTQGTRGQRGRYFCERLWTVIAACTLQKRSVMSGCTQLSVPTSMGVPFLLCCWVPPDSLLSRDRQFFAKQTVHPVNGYVKMSFLFRLDLLTDHEFPSSWKVLNC